MRAKGSPLNWDTCDVTPVDLQDLMMSREHEIRITKSGALEVVFEPPDATYVHTAYYVWLEEARQVPSLAQWLDDDADEVLEYWIAQDNPRGGGWQRHPN